MTRHTILAAIWACAVALTGCLPKASVTNETSGAESRMRAADSLAEHRLLPQAAQEYEAIAEDYPTSHFHETAVRKAAYLYCDPSNPEVDEAASLYWFKIYHEMDIAKEEKSRVETIMGLLERIVELRSTLTRKTDDLEQRIKFVNDELKRLKDVDAKFHERRVKK